MVTCSGPVRLGAALLLLLACVSASGQEMPVPVETQVPIFLKVVTFEKRIAGEKTKDFVLGVAYQSGYRLSVAVKDKFVDVARGEAPNGPAGRALRIVPLDLDGGESLDVVVSRAGVAALYVTPLRAFDVAQIAAVTRRNGVLSLTGVPAYVEAGLSITLTLSRDRPRILVNLAAARAEGAELAASLLNLATVFQGEKRR